MSSFIISYDIMTIITSNVVIIPKSVKDVGWETFSNAKIQNLIFEDGSQFEIIRRSLFFLYEGNTVNIPASAKTIENEAFFLSKIQNVI